MPAELSDSQKLDAILATMATRNDVAKQVAAAPYGHSQDNLVCGGDCSSLLWPQRPPPSGTAHELLSQT